VFHVRRHLHEADANISAVVGPGHLYLRLRRSDRCRGRLHLRLRSHVRLSGVVEVLLGDGLLPRERDVAVLIKLGFGLIRLRHLHLRLGLRELRLRLRKLPVGLRQLSERLIDYVATSDDDLFHQMEGKSFKRFDGQTVTLKLSGQPIVPFGMTLKERILGYLMDPNVSFILLAIGALALYAEFNHPGAVIPGTVGVVFILIAAFALNLLPTRFAALVLILGAFALFAAEAKFASHGVLTVGGITLLTLGGLLLVDSPIPEMRVHLLTALAVSIPLGLITAFLMSIAFRARRNKLVSGAQGLIGETGIAWTTLSPGGKIFVHGEIWDAVSSSPVPIGQSVVVRRIDGLLLQVEPVAVASPLAAIP